MDCLLHSSPALVQRVAGQPHNVEGIHDRNRVRELFGGGGLEAGEPVHRNDLDRVAPGLRPIGEPLLERLLRATLDRPSSNPAGPVPSRMGVRSRRPGHSA